MKLIPTGLSRTIARQVLLTKKNSPHIFFVGGVAGLFGSTFLACRATLQLDEKLDDIKADLDTVKSLHNEPMGDQGVYPDEKEYYKDLLHVYGKSAKSLGRLYGPSLAVGAVSVAALTGSHIQLTRRNAALTATLASALKAYDEYRLRVQEEIGKERELDIYRATKTEVVDGEGKKKQIVKVTDPNGLSIYARIFDETSPYWEKSNEDNRVFLQMQQNYLNHRLHAYGHVFLNEAYDKLGFERTSAGAIVGWVLDGEGDGYVDFGLFEASSSRFTNGLERNIILDFNVDGVIYDKIEQPRRR